MSKKSGYSGLQIALHWGVAVLIGVNYVVSDGMGRALDNSLQGKAVTGLTPTVHVYVGLAVLILVLLRLLVRRFAGAPEPMPSGHPFTDKLAEWTHWLLYLLMIVVPALGVITWYGGLEVAADPHEISVNLMMILIGLHAAAAIFHHFVLKDGLLTRMLRTR